MKAFELKIQWTPHNVNLITRQNISIYLYINQFIVDTKIRNKFHIITRILIYMEKIMRDSQLNCNFQSTPFRICFEKYYENFERNGKSSERTFITYFMNKVVRGWIEKKKIIDIQ